MRASKTQAALYYLARLIHGGEPATVIARRMLILASEDIGNAHPFALVLAQSTFAAVHQLGYPEARIPLSQCCIYLCEAPKSNRSYLAIDRAIQFVNDTGSPPIPLNLTNGHQAFDKSQGRGTSYINPHEAAGKAANLPYFPPGLKEPIFYVPGTTGLEQRLHDTPKYPQSGSAPI
jgi:putative ATPase